MIQPVGGRENEMYYIDKYNREHPKYSPPSYTKPTPYYNRYPSKNKGGYVSPSKGYVPTRTITPIDLEYQRLYGQYLDRKASELNKIYNTINERKQNAIIYNPILKKQINSYKRGTPIPGDGRWDKFVENLKEAGKIMKEGISNKDPKKVLVGGGTIVFGITMIVGGLTDPYSKQIKEALKWINTPSNST